MKKYLVIVAILVAMLLAGCGGGAEEPAEMDVVSMVYLPYLGSGFIDIGIANGYYAEQNIEIEKVVLPRASEGLVPFLDGEVDVMSGLIDSTMVNMLIRADDVKFTVSTAQVVPDAECSPYLIFMSADKIGEIESVEDFAGMTFWGLGDQLQFWYSQLLAQGGLTIDDVEFSNLPITAAQEALVEGAVDVVWASQPRTAQYLEDDRLAVYIDPTKYMLLTQSQVLFYGPTFAENEDLANRFTVATLQSMRAFNEGPTESNIEIIAEAFDMDPEFLASMCWGTRTADGRVDIPSSQAFVDWAFEIGRVDEQINIADYYDESYIDQANEVLGPAN